MTTKMAMHVAMAGALAACGSTLRDEPEATSAPTGVSDGTTGDDLGDDGDADGATTGAEEADSTEDGMGPKLDVAADPTMDGADTGDEMGCRKVDFLFVIDNSGSMGDEQSNLVASFPGFIETIRNELDEAQDFHILVTDVDAYVYEMCDAGCGCTPEGGMCDGGAGPECFLGCAVLPLCAIDGGFVCGTTMPMECEDVLGAGVTYPRGSGATNADCDFSSGARYIDSTEPDLTAAFTCAAGVGVGSWAQTERPMEAMVLAVTPGTDAATCNEGWIRDDAILVVTFITDEDDGVGDSAGTAAGWKAALVAAKGGDESAVVVLGLFGDNDQPAGICEDLSDMSTDGAEAAPRLREFVNSWGDHGVFGSVCADSYDAFFMEAVGIIDTTCEEFVPPAG